MLNKAVIIGGTVFVSPGQILHDPVNAWCQNAGAYIRQHNLQPGDCVAIKRTFDDQLHIVINPDTPANGRDVGFLPGQGGDKVESKLVAAANNLDKLPEMGAPVSMRRTAEAFVCSNGHSYNMGLSM